MKLTRDDILRRQGRTVIATMVIAVALGLLAYVLLSRGRMPKTPRTSDSGASEPSVSPATAPGPAPATAPMNPEQVIPGHQIGPVTLGMTQEQVTAALGRPNEKLNKMWSWKDPQMSVGFGPDSKVIVILAGGVGVTPKRVPFRTPEGIGIGATPELVIAAWGEPDSDETEKGPQGLSRQMKYAARGIHLLFYDGKLTWLSVRPAAAATQPVE